MTKAMIFAALGVLALAACSEAGRGDQAGGDNGSASAADTNATAGEVTAAAGSNADIVANDGAEVSSGMPVPGTNTPEHVVVNEPSNDSGNRR